MLTKRSAGSAVLANRRETGDPPIPACGGAVSSPRPSKQRAQLKAATAGATLMAAVVMMVPFWAAADELRGHKGDRLKGSISCIHPNIIHDLIGRVGEAENYTGVLRIYVQQGYCLEADIPTVLERPLAGQTFRTWDGHEAEIWQTVLELDRGDGTTESLGAYSIVFPQQMKQVKQAYGDRGAGLFAGYGPTFSSKRMGRGRLRSAKAPLPEA
jgi:hypothetical protein